MRIKSKYYLFITSFLLSGCVQSSLYYREPAFYAYLVSDAENGYVYDESYSSVYATPASCLKVVTGLLAFKTLGPEFRFETVVYHDVVKNNLVIQFSGDPTLSSKDLELLLSAFRHKKFNKVILSKSYLIPQEHSPLIGLDDIGKGYAQPVSSINIDENIIKISIAADGNIENDAGYKVNSELNISSENKKIHAIAHKDAISIRGSIEKGAEPKTLYISPKNIKYYAVLKIQSVLHNLGIQGVVEIADNINTTKYKLVNTHYSEALKDFIKPAMKASDNFVFDALYLKIIHESAKQKVQSWEEGDAILKSLIKTHFNLDFSDAFFADGSGLSRHSRMQPKQLVALLRESKDVEEFKNALAVPREEKSTLKNSDIMLNVRAKTGSLTGISCLCGFIEDEQEEKVFAIMASAFNPPAKNVRKTIDEFINDTETHF